MFKKLRERKIRKAIAKALQDGVLSDSEAEDLDRLSRELRIEPTFLEGLRTEHFYKRIKPVLGRVLATRRLTPEDEDKITKVCARLKVNPDFIEDLAIYRALWEIETTGTYIPRPVEARIMLKKGEDCFHVADATWAQIKTARQNHGYVGGSVGFRVAKGVTLRLGRAIPCVSQSEQLVDISHGTLNVTSTRLVFDGARKSTTITYGRLVNYELFGDALEIRKTSGRPDVFKMRGADVEMIDAVLQSLDA